MERPLKHAEKQLILVQLAQDEPTDMETACLGVSLYPQMYMKVSERLYKNR